MVKTSEKDVVSEETQTREHSRVGRAIDRVHDDGVDFFESGSDGSILWLFRRIWQWGGVFVEGLNDWLTVQRVERMRRQGAFDEESLGEIEGGE